MNTEGDRPRPHQEEFDGSEHDTGPIRLPPLAAAPRPANSALDRPLETEFTTAMEPVADRYPATATPSPHDLGLVRDDRPSPNRGWRKLVHQVSGGTVNPGLSRAEAHSAALEDRSNQPVRGAYSIAVLSLKGGVGKTTTTVGLGATLASIRGDRVIAVDANPDFGTLSQRGPVETRSTVRDVLNDDSIFRYSDVRRHTSQSPSRLEILASERDPAVSESFSGADYRTVHDILDRFYNIILTDCGTGLTHSAMEGVLDQADSLVLVASPAVDSARSALATLDWLALNGHQHLIPDATVVISSARPGPTPVDIGQLTRYFLTRVRSVIVIPFDSHLAEGAEVSLDLMNPSTRTAFMELAAAVADGFDRPKGAATARRSPPVRYE